MRPRPYKSIKVSRYFHHINNFTPHKCRKLLALLYIIECSVLYLLQDEKNQLLVTNVWLKLVS